MIASRMRSARPRLFNSPAFGTRFQEVRMANEGTTPIEEAFSFVMQLIVSVLLPGWGPAMVVLGLMWGMFWWFAMRFVVLAIGIVVFTGSSLITPYLGGRRFS
jgi:hypothetical protein